MQHKLIMLAGSSPGAGKSTLSEFLFDQLTRSSMPTRWIYEEDILHIEAFAPVIQFFQHGQGDAIEALLGFTCRFVQDALSADEVVITDSIFPAYTWLFAAGYSRAQIAAFSAQLARLLAPLPPLTIYLDSDVATSLTRAVAQRGRPWLDDLIAAMQTYTYCQTHPVRDMGDVIGFFESVRQLSLELLADWPHPTLALDTIAAPLDQIGATLLQHLDLPAQTTVPMSIATDLHQYVGVYIPRDTAAASPPLEIRLVDGALIVNTYWPNGCRLLPEGPAQFRLQSTNRRVTFDTQPQREPSGLTYAYGGGAYHYDKTQKEEPQWSTNRNP
jgi:thymidylate kinase